MPPAYVCVRVCVYSPQLLKQVYMCLYTYVYLLQEPAQEALRDAGHPTTRAAFSLASAALGAVGQVQGECLS